MRASHDDAIIGGLNNGWAVANTTLAFERAGLGGGGSGAGGGAFPGKKGGVLDARVGDIAEGVGRGRAVQPAAFGGSYERLRDIAEKVGVAADPLIRQRLAELYTLTEIGRMTSLRMRAARGAGKGSGGGEGNIAKLLMSQIIRLSRDLGPAILGAEGMLVGESTTGGGVVQEMTLFAPGAVDLRRHRPDPAEHHRRARARAPQGARPAEGDAVPRAEGRNTGLTCSPAPASCSWRAIRPRAACHAAWVSRRSSGGCNDQVPSS